MSDYIKISEEEISKASMTDLHIFLESLGEKLKKESNYKWRDGSDAVYVKDNLWFSHYEDIGGDAISFVMKYYDKAFKEAVEFLLDTHYVRADENNDEKKEFELPKANDDMRKVIDFLTDRRGIDKDIVYEFVKANMLYEEYYYHNAVFLGYDTNGVPRHANKRGIWERSKFKNNAPGSESIYSFHWNGKNDSIYFFESPIDLMSYISMHKEHWKENSYAAACSVSSRVLMQCLKDNPKLKHVYICLDNDAVGQKAARQIEELLKDNNQITTKILTPSAKDWNEDLLISNKEGEEECQELSL